MILLKFIWLLQLIPSFLNFLSPFFVAKRKIRLSHSQWYLHSCFSMDTSSSTISCPSTPRWNTDRPFLTGRFHQVTITSF